MVHPFLFGQPVGGDVIAPDPVCLDVKAQSDFKPGRFRPGRLAEVPPLPQAFDNACGLRKKGMITSD